MLLIFDGPRQNFSTGRKPYLDDMTTSMSLWEPRDWSDPRAEEFDTIGAMARDLAGGWAAQVTRQLEGAGVLAPYQRKRLASTFCGRMERRLTREATACLRLLWLIDAESTFPVTVLTESRWRAQLFSRLLVDRGVPHSVVRQGGRFLGDVIEAVKPRLRGPRDLTRFLATQLHPSKRLVGDRRAMIVFPTPQSAEQISRLVTLLKSRGMEVTFFGNRELRSATLPDLSAIRRVHRFMKMFKLYTDQMTQIDAAGAAALPFPLWRSAARDVIYGMIMEIELLSEAIGAVGPEVVMYTTVSRSELVASVARDLGVPTMWLQATELPLGRTDLSTLDADRFMVLGEAYKERFVKAGVPAKRVLITGSDHCMGGGGPGRREARERVTRDLGLDVRDDLDRLVIFASQRQDPERNTPTYRRLVFASVAEAVKALPRTRLVVKLHPLETAAGVTESFADHLDRSHIAVVQDYDLDVLLEASDAVLILWSTVGLQAIARQKPVVVLHYKDGEPEVSSPAEGAALCVKDPSRLNDALRTVLWDEVVRDTLHQGGRRFLERHLFRNDGRAWERVADAIDTLRASAPPEC